MRVTEINLKVMLTETMADMKLLSSTQVSFQRLMKSGKNVRHLTELLLHKRHPRTLICDLIFVVKGVKAIPIYLYTN
jgi:hypothetical protein